MVSDWPSVLLQTLRECPLVTKDVFNQRIDTNRSRLNVWQCHVLSCLLSCLAPCIRAQIADWKLCSSPKPKPDQEPENEANGSESIQVACQETCKAIKQVQKYVHGCIVEDTKSLLIATACTGEAFTVHLHNLFWSVCNLVISTRLALGFSIEGIAPLIDKQISCWGQTVSRYFQLGAEKVDVQNLIAHFAQEGQAYYYADTLFSTEKILCNRMKLESSRDLHLQELRIDIEHLVFSNSDTRSDSGKYVAASLAGQLDVSVKHCDMSFPQLNQYAATLIRVHNPFISHFIGWSENEDGSFYLIVEAMQTDLESLIKSCQNKSGETSKISPFPFHKAFNIILQIAKGIKHLHQKRIAHRNIRSSSIYISDTEMMNIKICDLDLCQDSDQEFEHGVALDVYTFGMLCIEILTGKNCNNVLSLLLSAESGSLISRKSTQDILEDTLKTMPASTPSLLIACLKACCDGDPQARPGFGAICALLHQLKPIVTKPSKLERLLETRSSCTGENYSELEAGYGESESAPDEMDIRVRLIELNLQLLHKITPEDIYPVVAEEMCRAPRKKCTEMTPTTCNLSKSERKADITEYETEYEIIEVDDEEDKTKEHSCRAPEHSSTSGLGFASATLSLDCLEKMAEKLRDRIMEEGVAEKEALPSTSGSRIWHKLSSFSPRTSSGIPSPSASQNLGFSAQMKFVVSNASTLRTDLVGDGWSALLKPLKGNGNNKNSYNSSMSTAPPWSSTSIGIATLEAWLPRIAAMKWRDAQELALGMALCLRHVSKTPPRLALYSAEQGTIDGFYPIYPGNILLNAKLRVAMVLDNTRSAWRGMVQFAGVHPQVGDGDNVLISIEAYTTFYFGHLLSCIVQSMENFVAAHMNASSVSVLSSSSSSSSSCYDQHLKFVLKNIATRCIQLKYISMAEVVTVLLNDSKPSSKTTLAL